MLMDNQTTAGKFITFCAAAVFQVDEFHRAILRFFVPLASHELTIFFI